MQIKNHFIILAPCTENEGVILLKGQGETEQLAWANAIGFYGQEIVDFYKFMLWKCIKVDVNS